METITYEELMSVDGGRLSYSGFTGRGRHAKHRSWWSRHKKTIKSHGRAAVRGLDWGLRAITFYSWL